MDSLLNLIFRTTGVEPRYHEDLCLAAGKSVACSECREVCPHEAITIGRRVEIDDVDCSGCGLCVHACPSGALEPRLSFDPGPSLRCSKVAGSAQSIHCLGRLQPSDLLRLLGAKEKVTLAHSDCATCPIGGVAVAEALGEVRDRALELAALHDRHVSIEVLETERLDEEVQADRLSRRELLRSGWRSVQDRAGELLAPLDPGEDEPDLPREMQRRYRIIAAARPEPEDMVPWSLPRVSDACIMCPICTNACPTGALERVFEAGGDGSLRLRPERCMSCDACVSACPVDAVAMEEPISWAELSGGQREAHRRGPRREQPGSVAR